MITHCVCFGESFVELKKFNTLEAIQKETGCGTSCKLCVPYIKKMLETGETEFDILD